MHLKLIANYIFIFLAKWKDPKVFSCIFLFLLDPRMWNKWEVVEWLKWATDRYSIRDVMADKFLMNGKGLCMLGVEGFLYRVPKGGEVLHSDFNKRVIAAVEQSRHLQSYLNPGTSNFYYVY